MKRLKFKTTKLLNLQSKNDDFQNWFLFKNKTMRWKVKLTLQIFKNEKLR